MSVIVTLTGPSCAGKSTLEALLVKRGLSKIISHTTRPKRAGEVDGQDYYFITPEEFKKLRDGKRFVEVVEFNGNSYAAAKDEFTTALDAGRPVVVVCEPQGRDEILGWAEIHEIPTLPVFVTNPSNVIAERFVQRYFGDFALALGKPGEGEKLIKSATGRLDAMLGEEVHWRGALLHPYAITFGAFNKDNQDRVVGHILDRIRKLS